MNEKRKKKKKETRPIAPRNPALERQLCDAIKRHRAVRVTYESESFSRTFEPYIVFRSQPGRILVGGTETRDDSQPGRLPEPRYYEVGRISSFSVTDKVFKYDNRFDPTRDEYSGRIICVIQRIEVSD